jgi:alpha-beta hydrolase superfamily lysophospholipase
MTTDTSASRSSKVMPDRSSAKGTILMIHGAWCTGEVWDRMATSFRDLGWRVETPTIGSKLRLEADPSAELSKLALTDYLAEVEGAARRIHAETGRLPVVFGHSLGGFLAQKLAERRLVRAVVLLTPSAPAGLPLKPSLGLLAPLFTMANLVLTTGFATKATKIWKTGFKWGMMNRVPPSRHSAIYATTCYDSSLVMSEMSQPDKDPQRTCYVDETRVLAPVLTVGAAQDRTVPVDVQRRIAEKYERVGGDYLEYADNAHWIVDEPGTEQVIADVARWLEAHAIGRRSFEPNEFRSPSIA